jgi:hypothetical protein
VRLPVALERLGRVLVVLTVVAMVVLLLIAAAIKLSAADLHSQAATMRGDGTAEARTPIGNLLSRPMSPTLDLTDEPAVERRAFQLDEVGDRVIELTAVVALLGMLFGLLTTREVDDTSLERETNTPLAATNSNGTV